MNHRSTNGRVSSPKVGPTLIAVGVAVAVLAIGSFVAHRPATATPSAPPSSTSRAPSRPSTTVTPLPVTSPPVTSVAASPTAPAVTDPAFAPAVPGKVPSTDVLVPTSAPSPVVVLPQRSATLDQLPVRSVVAPTELRIDTQRIDAPVVPVSAAPDDGELVIPATATQIAWYQYGAAPGDVGSSVLAAHVDWHGDLGVFYNLRRVAIGAPIDVTLADGRVLRFVVDSLEQISKAALPTEQIFRRDGPPQLVLITCGGHFDRQTHHYDDNVIVFASLE